MKSILLIIAAFCFHVNTGLFSQSTTVRVSGDIFQVVLPAAAMGSTLIWKDGSKPGLQFLKSYGTSFVLTHSLKRIIDKKRPDGGNHAFPSGHTSSAFTGAAFLQKRYGWKVGLPSYLLASYVGWTRIYADKHDIWDIFGGAVTGILSAYLFSEKYEPGNIQLSFEKNNQNFNFALSLRF